MISTRTTLGQPASSMSFGRTDSPSQTVVSAFSDTGQITITVQNTEVPGHACDNELTLAQTIHLRDFLNRHIDGLALAATGSLAERAADDPAQLASVEELPRCRTCGDQGEVFVRKGEVHSGMGAEPDPIMASCPDC